MPPKKSPTAAIQGENASGDAAKLARQAALAAKKAEFAAKLALAKAAREKAAPAEEEEEDEEEGEDEADEEEEEEQSSSRKSVKQPHTVSTTARNSSNAHSSTVVQQRGSKLQKRANDADASTGVEVEESTIDELTTTTAAPAKKLELSHYFLPTDSGDSWKLSPIEFERFGLKSPINTKVDQSVINNELMFPSLPPVWKRDQLYVPESLKNEQSRIPIQERTNKIMYDLDQPSRPHRRLILPQIYPNAVQTEQLNLLANQDLILDELRKTAPLKTGQEDPSIQALFGPKPATDIEMKDTSSSLSSSTTLTAAVQAEIDAAASKCYAFDYSLATNRAEFGPFMFHFHARPIVCERERKKSDEQYLNDLLLAKQVQEKVKLLMKAVKHHESQMDVTAATAAGVETKQSEAEIKLVQYSKVYSHLCASREPTHEDSTSIPTGDFALFLTWFISEPSHDLKSRQFAGDLLVRFFLIFSAPNDLPITNEDEKEDEEKKDSEGEEDAEEEEEEEEEEKKVTTVADAPGGALNEDETERGATRGDLKMKNETADRMSVKLGPPLQVSASNVYTNNLELCRTFSQYSQFVGAADLLASKQTLPSLSRISRLSAHELAAIKGLLFQFALKKTDEKLLASIVKVRKEQQNNNVLGLISAVEDFSGSWLTYIQALAFSAGTYDQPIRTGVNPPPPSESAETCFSCLGESALSHSDTYPLPQPYVCFSILFDLCAHHYMFSRNHFAMTNGVFDLIQSIVGTTLIQRLWQPNEESQILNAVLECSRNSGQPPAINLDGYLTYAIMDLFHRSYVSGDYSRLMRGSLPLSILMCMDSWDETVLHEGEELVLDASQPNVLTLESAIWIAPFIRLIFKECGSKEWIDEQMVWDQTLWRSLPHVEAEAHDVWNYANQASPTVIASNYQRKAWDIWSFFITTVFLLNPMKPSFDVVANLLDLLRLILPRMESTVHSQWYAWNGANLIRWRDYDLPSLLRTCARIRDRSTEANQYLTTWLDEGLMDANMSGREPETARERLMPVYKNILGTLDIYAMRLKLEERSEMVWEINDADPGLPRCLQRAIDEYMARPPPVPVPEGEVYHHLQELTPFEKVNWAYMAEVAVRIGLIKVDPTHPLGYSYVDPDLEYDPQQHRDLSPEINLLLESINILEAHPGARTSPYINFLRSKVIKYMSESIHLSMRLQALVHLNKHWKELLLIDGQDLDYTAKVELVKSYGVDDLLIPNVLIDIITDYAIPRRSIHHSYMNFLSECIHSTHPLVGAYAVGILKAMYDSCKVPTTQESFSQYYFVILFEGLEVEAQGLIANGLDDAIMPYLTSIDIKTVSMAISTSANEFNQRELGAMRMARQVIFLLQATLKPPATIDDPPRYTFTSSFMMPFYERFRLLFTPETKQYRYLIEQFDELDQLMKQIIEPKEKEPEASPADLSTTGFKFTPASQFDFSAITTSGTVSEPTKPFVFNFGPATNASMSNSPTTTTTPFGGFSLSSTTVVTSDPTRTIEISNSVLEYLSAHSSDFAVVHQYHESTHFHQTEYDSQIWFRTLQPLLKLVDSSKNDIDQLITILTQLLERPNLDATDTLIILHALTPFVALISGRISIPSTLLSQPSMPFTFNLGPSTGSTIAPPTSTSASTPFTFNFGSSTASTAAAATNSSPAPGQFIFNFGNSTTAAPPVSNFVDGHVDQNPSKITINPNPSANQLPTIIRSLINSLFRLIQSTDSDQLVDVVIGNLVSSFINQLLLYPSLSTSDIETLIKEWVSSCPSNPFQIEPDDYLRSPPWLLHSSHHQTNTSSSGNDLGVWYLPPLKLRFRFLLHLRHTCFNAAQQVGLRQTTWLLQSTLLTEYFMLHLTTHTNPPQSRQTYLFIISFLPVQQRPLDPVTFLNSLIHLVEPLTLIPLAEWSEMDDAFSDALIRWICRSTMHIEDAFPYEPHQRSQRIVMGRFIFKYLERLSHRSREYLEERGANLEKRYQWEQTAKKSFSLTASSSYPTRPTSTTTTGATAGVVSPFNNPFHVPTAIASNNLSPSTNLNSNFGLRARQIGNVILHPLHEHSLTYQQIQSYTRPPCSLCGFKSNIQYHCLQCSRGGPILCQDCTTFTPTKLVEFGFELLWKCCSSYVRQLVGLFSIIHPFAQLDPEDESVVEFDSALNQIVPSLNTAVRGLKSHPDRTLFYHAPRKGIRYTCLACTKSYAETSSYYDPCDDSHWCFNCIQWTNELTTSVQSRQEFDRIYQLQLKEFHDQQLLTIRPSPSNVVTPVSSEQLQHAVSTSVKPNQIRTRGVICILGAVNKLFVTALNSTEYRGMLADLGITPDEFNDLKAAHVHDLKKCLECDLSSMATDSLPKLSAWQQAYRSVALLGLFPIKWYEYPEILASVTQVLTVALQSDVMISRFQALTYLFRERNQNISRKILRHYFTTCYQQLDQAPTSSVDSCMTIGAKFESALLQTIGCSDPILRTLARSMYVVRAETVPTLLLMDFLNNKFDAEDTDVLQLPTLLPLTYSLQTIPFVYAFVRENFDSKVMTGIRRTMGAISHALNYPVMDPQLREARAGLGRLIQQKWLSSLTFVEKVNAHKATNAYAKLVQEGINSSQPRTPPIPKAVVQFLTKLISQDGLENAMVDLYDWLRTVSQRSTAETVLLSQLDSDDVNTAIHDTPQLRSTLDAMITLHTTLPFLPFHMSTIKSYISVATAKKSPLLIPSILNLPRLVECMLNRCVKSPLLRRLVIHPYYNLWITCCMLRSYYLIPLLRMEAEPSSPFISLFLDRLKYSDDEELDMDTTCSPGSIVLLTEILMYPPRIAGACDVASGSVQTGGTISTALWVALPWLFDHMYEYAIELVQMDTPSEGRIELPNLNELFTRVRSWMSQRQPNKRNGFLSPPLPTVGDTTIPCVFIDSLALMIQTVIQLPQLTPHQQSTKPADVEKAASLELLSYRLVALLPIVLATFNLYATTCLADLDNQCQPLLVSMRQYLRVIHQQLKQEKLTSQISATATTITVGDSSVANRLNLRLIVQLFLPTLKHFYSVTYMNLVNQIEWYDLVDGLNLNGRPKKMWSWMDVPESQLLNEVSQVE